MAKRRRTVTNIIGADESVPVNNALSFNGTDNCIEVPMAPPTANGGAITIEFWNHAEASTPTESFMFAGATKQPGRILCHAPFGGSVVWDYGDFWHGGRLQAPYSEHLGKWTHIALVHSGADQDPGHQAIHLNGKRVASQASRQTPEGTFTRLLIGAGLLDHTGEIGHFNKGAMDGFRVWNVARSEEEILRDMHAELIGDEPGLVACFNFNWGIANTDMSWLRGDPWKTLPNSVPGAPDGVLRGFRATDYVESGVPATAPVGPVFSMVKDSVQFLTAAPRERDAKVAAGWTAAAAPAFYAHRAPAPGTTPLYRLVAPSTGRTTVTADRAERARLDPRLHVDQTPGAWAYDDEVAYVAGSRSGDAVPLHRYLHRRDRTEFLSTDPDLDPATYEGRTTVCHVLPRIDAQHLPSPISSTAEGLLDGVWYVLVHRPSREGWGVAPDGTGGAVVEEIPRTGEYARFQWRLHDGRLVNRAAPDRVLVLADGAVRSAALDAGAAGQRWTFARVPGRGTDCFSLRQGATALTCSTAGLGTATDPTGDAGSWTLLAMELAEGRSLPGPAAEHSGLPFSKHLAVTDVRGGRTTTLHVLGTGTVSDRAMLRVRLVVENMVGALRPGVDVSGLDGVEVLVISQDDSNEELDDSPCIGYLHTAEQIEETRGGAHVPLCYVTEEMMWRSGTYNSGSHVPHPRWLDQVVHEFGHMLHKRLDAVDETRMPLGEVPAGTAPRVAAAAREARLSQQGIGRTELYAIGTQSWFGSLAQTDPTYFPGTRSELRAVFPERYAFLAAHLDPANTWTPPLEPRRPPLHTAGWSVRDGRYAIGLDTGHGNLEVEVPGGEYVFGTSQAYGIRTAAFTFTATGALQLLDADGAVLRTFSGAAGRWPFRLAVVDDAGSPRRLVVQDRDGTTLCTVLPA